jgi:hypothetical protein
MSNGQKLIKDVLVKIARGGAVDRVMYVDNVPEDFFYEMRHPMKCTGKGVEQHYEPDLEKPKVATLYEELSLSQTGDRGIVFDLGNEQASQRFLALVRFIKSMTPATQMPIEPKPYSVDPSDTRANTIPLTEIPRAVLPVLSPASNDAGTVKAAPSINVDEQIKVAVDKAITEYIEKQEQLEYQRTAKKAGVTNPLLSGEKK